MTCASTGIGIQARLFGSAGEGRTGGAGSIITASNNNGTYTDDQLSVQLATAIIKAHNGTLTFTHTVQAGVGSTCIVVLPCKQSHTGESKPVDIFPLELQRALPPSDDSRPDTAPSTSNEKSKSLLQSTDSLPSLAGYSSRSASAGSGKVFFTFARFGFLLASMCAPISALSKQDDDDSAVLI